MAQVIDYYGAVAGGSSAMYYYAQPDNYSTATRISTGTVIQLVADYAQRMVGKFYRLQSPDGWIHWYHVQNISPVYKTVTDACTPPSSLSLNAQSGVLTIRGGAGGDLNALTGFGVSYRERGINQSTWGAWSADTVVTGRSVNVTATSGMVRQYRVRTYGEAGSDYYSKYTRCQDLLSGNAGTGTPVILLPIAGAMTCAELAAFVIDCPRDPDDDDMILQRSLDGGEWTDVAEVLPQGGRVTDVFVLPGTEHAVKYRMKDTNGAIGSEDGIVIQQKPIEWVRTIGTDDVIANREVSFANDLAEMRRYVNLLRAFYGLSDMAWPGTTGRFGDVQAQLAALQSAIDECRTATSRAAYGFTSPAGFPTAGIISQLRLGLTQT